jgi:rhomboid protease GluP
MFKRQTSGAVSCPSCRQLVDIQAKTCPHCGRRNPGMWGYAPQLQRLGVDLGFVAIVTWGCIALYLATLLVDLRGITIWGGSGLGSDLLSPSLQATFLFGSTGSIPVFSFGRWWTVLSAPWLHGSLFHIAFNLAIFRYFAPGVAKLYGAGRLVILYTAACACGSLLTSVVGAYFQSLPPLLHGANFSVGASGGIFGLLGALVSEGQRQKDPELMQNALSYALGIFALGFLFPNTDNWGHLGGFLGGFFVAKLVGFDPRDREGHRHLVAAIACLFATFLSIIVSVVSAIGLR